MSADDPVGYVSPLIPTWRNCRADIGTYAHERSVQMFLDDVAVPSIRRVDERIAESKRSEEAFALFEASDLRDLRTETLKAFCLSLQSMFETQIRGYLCGCAEELEAHQPNLIRKLQRDPWGDVKDHFLRLRKVPFSHFSAHRDLDLLHELGSYCRHGEGTASQKIRTDFVDFCVHVPAAPPLFPDSTGEPERYDIAIDTQDLERFTTAIVSFWSEAEWIYNNSISRKGESLVRELKKREEELRSRALAYSANAPKFGN